LLEVISAVVAAIILSIRTNLISHLPFGITDRLNNKNLGQWVL
jgi:hypothetical protein